MCTGSFHADINFLAFHQLLGSHGAVLMVYPFLFYQILFLEIYLFLGVTADFLPG